MSQTTRLIVGSAFTLDLGVAVGVPHVEGGNGLRLDSPTVDPGDSGTSWFSLSLGKAVGSSHDPAIQKMANLRSKWVPLVGFVLALGVGWWWSQMIGHPTAPLTPAETAPAPVAKNVQTGVEQVNTPYLEDGAVVMSNHLPEPQLPFGSPGGPVQGVNEPPESAAKIVPPDVKAAQVAVTAVKPVAVTPTTDKVESKPNKVSLSAVDSQKKAPAPGKSEVSVPSGSVKPEKSAARTDESKAPAVVAGVLVNEDSEPQPAKAEKPGVTLHVVPNSSSTEPAKKTQPVTKLVAITPDGKSAVFSDPVSKLPVQVRIGQKLPTGDTLVSVSASAGKVTTSTKEYHLD